MDSIMLRVNLHTLPEAEAEAEAEAADGVAGERGLSRVRSMATEVSMVRSITTGEFISEKGRERAVNRLHDQKECAGKV
jgi:hypothetical protein